MASRKTKVIDLPKREMWVLDSELGRITISPNAGVELDLEKVVFMLHRGLFVLQRDAENYIHAS